MPPLPVVEVAVSAPIDRLLSYLVPETLAEQILIGSRVMVPLGRRQVVGYVLGWGETEPNELKEVTELLDAAPLFHQQHARFYQRAADYYAYPIGAVMRAALPSGLSGKQRAPAILTDSFYAPTAMTGEPRGERQRAILAAVRASGGELLSALRKQFETPHAALKRLVELGFLEVSLVERRRDPFLGEVIPHPVPALNGEQQQVLDRLTSFIDQLPGFAPALLHGVTGSGKTEIYLQSIERVLARGRQALVMVPEIALTPQLVARFRGRFMDGAVRLAVLHSGLSDGERYDAWRAVAAGEVDVVIGARSAVFAPLPRLGLIVVDEEHDASYKQSESFRYNARDLALLRGQQQQALVLLGSATPSLTSYHAAGSERWTYLSLPFRGTGVPLPEVRLIDMSAESASSGLSSSLVESLMATVAAGEQALLLLNRRGYAPFLLCYDCGATLRCPNCAITLTYSRVNGELRCHYCDFRIKPPSQCERCGGPNLLPEGQGTERLEEELHKLLPEARIARMDRDTTTRKGSHLKLIEAMTAGEIDVLIGTQMIAKGHDFPKVTLVGVMNADAPLNLPDFRSSERVFSLLSQVAGRAGRGERAGRVLIQTYAPDHYALEHVVRHDYAGFARFELAQRECLNYPPYGYLANLVFSGNDLAQVEAAAAAVQCGLVSFNSPVEILGPAPCLLARLRGKYRMQILLKASRRPPLRGLLTWLKGRECRVPAGVTLAIDVDPLDMF
ncbi:MAG: primosomal protein N' [Desulfuromonas sp.]|nr:MAG: primosomal protein N' [Desulfuromonas sp.]